MGPLRNAAARGTFYLGMGPLRNAAARMEQNGAMEVALQADGSHGANMWPVRKPHYYS